MNRLNDTTCRTYDVRRAAVLLGVSPSSLYKEASEHGTIAGLPVVRVGTRVLVSRQALDALLAGTPLPLRRVA